MTPVEHTIFTIFLMMFAYYTGKKLGRIEGFGNAVHEFLEEEE